MLSNIDECVMINTMLVGISAMDLPVGIYSPM
jgi:hypothetical protein